LNPASRAIATISGGVKKLRKGVPEAAAPFCDASASARSSASRSSLGGMKVIARLDPGASVAICRRVTAIASRVRYMVTPVDATSHGPAASKPADTSFSSHDPASTAHTYQRQNQGTGTPCTGSESGRSGDPRRAARRPLSSRASR
jgi:hypothetical protein